jgi:hypothetical protein
LILEPIDHEGPLLSVEDLDDQSRLGEDAQVDLRLLIPQAIRGVMPFASTCLSRSRTDKWRLQPKTTFAKSSARSKMLEVGGKAR